jgi:streptomycin 6-kinase
LAEAPGALLLERILLGDDIRPLAADDDDAATATAGAIYSQMHEAVAGQPRPPGLPELRGLGAALTAYWERTDATSPTSAPLPPTLVARAQSILAELTVPADTDIVLHGDAHHQNLIRHGTGDAADIWRVIDPHGWWGDPTFDAVALMLNLHGSLAMSQCSHHELRTQARRRADILAEAAGFDRARLLAWTFTGAVFAELRCLQDHGFVQGGPCKLAEALAGEA